MTFRTHHTAFLLGVACAVMGCRSGDAKPEKTPETTTSDAPTVAGKSLTEQHPDHDHAPGDIPVAACPVPDDASREPGKLLDTAADSYGASEFAAAYACADIAADLTPRSVDAHHIRAAAAAALGHYDVARVAFSMALALDPDDPETLAAAADFYINVLPPKRRDTTLVGLEHARRGRARAVVRRRTGRMLRARLALLEAQAYNDLGRGDEALDLVDEALKLAPDMAEAKHERGVAVFNLCRFDEALTAFNDVLRSTPDDPYAHHHLGMIYERLGQPSSSEAHFRRARELAPDEFWPPVLLSAAAFRDELARALDELDPDVRAQLQDVQIEVADYPEISDLLAVSPPFSPTILGLFRGLPLGVESADAPGDEPIPPRAIVLYRKNLARAVKTRAELAAQIRRTLLHEIGHLTGLDEGDLRRRGLD